MSPRMAPYGLRNARQQATHQRCPRPRLHTTAHRHRLHAGCDRQAAARIPIAFAPGTPALAFPAVSSPEACATPALRPWVIVVWMPVPGRYPTTLNISGRSVQNAPIVFGCKYTLPKSSVVTALSLNGRLRPEDQHNSRCNIHSIDKSVCDRTDIGARLLE